MNIWEFVDKNQGYVLLIVIVLAGALVKMVRPDSDWW